MMRRLMKVLQVERVVPYLFNCAAVEVPFAYLELNHKHDVMQDDYRIYPLAQPRVGIVKVDVSLSVEANQRALQQIDLLPPSVSLRQVNGERRCGGQDTKNLIGMRHQETRNGFPVVRTTHYFFGRLLLPLRRAITKRLRSGVNTSGKFCVQKASEGVGGFGQGVSLRQLVRRTPPPRLRLHQNPQRHQFID